ncbi:GtrA family protein [Agrobacterium rubi]|nr:GtrA family protein [Agrobacterium rubi]NTF24678.1 GtrA family protein [Agrobacterium rubi]
MKISSQVSRFAAVGVVASGVHLLVAGGILAVSSSTPTMLANMIAFVAAFSVSFVGHERFTFQKSGRRIRFFGASLCGLAINSASTMTMEKLTSMKPIYCISTGMLVAAICTFAASKLWVFVGKTNEVPA